MALIWTVLIIYLCLKTSTAFKSQLYPQTDKLVHFTFYFVFVILWYRFLSVRNKNTKDNAVKLFVASIIFGLIIEYCQYKFTINRTAEVLDVVANTLGSTIGIITAVYCYKIKKIA